ncbi:hypothetical protein [Nonomuraea sp. NPDC049784]|uniref:hypothetical protein n=1 Tax=Nonomuraea sp. NPDC049784 TaxID=3154361 RepID=UPI0033C2D5FE
MTTTVDGRRSDGTAGLVIWRVLWALMFATAALLAISSQLIPVYEYAWWDDMSAAEVDKDMLIIVRWMLQFAYIPAIISCALPVQSRIMQVFSAILGIAVSGLLFILPE